LGPRGARGRGSRRRGGRRARRWRGGLGRRGRRGLRLHGGWNRRGRSGRTGGRGGLLAAGVNALPRLARAARSTATARGRAEHDHHQGRTETRDALHEDLRSFGPRVLRTRRSKGSQRQSPPAPPARQNVSAQVRQVAPPQMTAMASTSTNSSGSHREATPTSVLAVSGYGSPKISLAAVISASSASQL